MDNDSRHNRKTILLTVLISALSLIFAYLVLYLILSPKDTDNTYLYVTASPSPFNDHETSTETIIKTPSPDVSEDVPTETPDDPSDNTSLPVLPQYLVLSSVNYSDGRTLSYRYTDRFIIASDKNKNIVLILQFDDEGNLIKRTEYRDTLYEFDYGITSWDFDENGKLAIFYRSGPGISTNVKYHYADSGTLSSTDTAYGLSDISTYEYDRDGNIIRQTAEMNNGTRIEYSYKDGVIAEEKYYGNTKDNAKLTYLTRYEYSGIGSILRSVREFYGENGRSVTGKNILEYDAHGNIVGSISDTGNGLTKNSRYEYDDRNSLMLSESEVSSDSCTEWNVHIEGSDNEASYYLYKYENDKQYIPYKYYRDNGHYMYRYYLDSGRYLDIDIGTDCEDSYDDKGRIVLRTYMDEYGISTSYRIYEYDDNGHLSREGLWEYDGGAEWYYYDLHYEYDNNKVIRVTNSGGFSVKTYTYNDKGVLVQYEYSSNSASNEYTVGFTYHENGALSGRYIVFSDGSSARFEYDETGNSLGNSYIEGTGKSALFDANGRIIREIKYSGSEDNSAIVSSKDFMYDDAGRITQVLDYQGDRQTLAQRTEYNYNSFGLRAGWTLYDSEDNEIFSYRRKYTPRDEAADAVGTGTPIQGETQYDMNGNMISLVTYDSFGNTITGVFSEDTEAIYRIYQKCSIADLIPEAW